MKFRPKPNPANYIQAHHVKDGDVYHRVGYDLGAILLLKDGGEEVADLDTLMKTHVGADQEAIDLCKARREELKAQAAG